MDASLAEQRAALASSLRVLGRAHPQTAEILRGMSEAERRLGQSVASRDHAEQALQILTGIFGNAEEPLRAAGQTWPWSRRSGRCQPATALARRPPPRLPNAETNCRVDGGPLPDSRSN
ncbi:tetratricopeptide repeat protein [Xanthomonas populi]|uniref:Tetratricopeptide repeat protein n=1 Tax=Xanthomonas populi TaxID=53414 RepID=A0A2S7F4F1_9XANT|nr:hypothetical protein XpopCFBP1817_01180 [Xanthomonas populi]